jgi:hypothetical protein
MRYSLLLLPLLSLGCGAEPAPNAFVPVAQVSPDILKAAKSALPNVAFESARKIKVQGQDAFEIRGKMPNGKIRELVVSTSGKVIEVD